MKGLITKITILILAFAVGISAVYIRIVKFHPDPNVYSVEFHDLIRESKSYDGKIVKLEAFYIQGYEASFLTNPNREEPITVNCFLAEVACDKAYNSLHDSLEKQERITVIGRYRDSEYQDYDGYVHTIEILDIP